ncbi:MAG: hybrid sensor histidine kinase/response regulator [Bdellovibrionales bacterium]|nr:hybrid sensor histidine kinase/response regulator [Bdellovibrionales bacterium]
MSNTTAKADDGGAGAAALSKLIATLTHELKTPLHSILSLADVLDSEIDGQLSDEQKRQVSMIKRNGGLLLEMITELLQYSSMSYRSHFLQREAVKLRELVEEQLEILQTVAVQKRISLDISLESVAETFVSDTVFLRQIVSNLVGNAVQYSPEGSTVSVYGSMGSKGEFKLDIVDSGEGIALHKQEEVFSELNRGKRSSAGGENVGLGLAIVKASVEGLNGSLEVKSEQGRGTMFRLVLPAAEPDIRTDSVLIIGADAASTTVIERCLAGEKFRCLDAAEFEDAKHIVHDADPCAIICDLELARKLGPKQLAALKARSSGRDRGVVVLAGFDSQKERAEAKSLGGSDFVAKPFDVDELLAKVLKHRIKA